MRKFMTLIMFFTLVSCSSKNINELDKMTDWNKSEINNKTRDSLMNLVESFTHQRDMDLKVLKMYNMEKTENGLMLIEKWNKLINITETMARTKLVGKLQVIKRKILMDEIKHLKVHINTQIEVKHGKKNSL